MQNWRLKNPDFDKNMTRPCEYGAWDFFVEQTNAPNSIITNEIKERAKVSMGNTIQIPVINYDGDVEISNVRSCVIPDSENTSALYTATFATLATGFTMVPAAFMNNDIDYAHDWSRKMEKHMRALASALDIRAVAALEAAKTTVFKDKLNYTATLGSLQIPTQMATEIVGDIDPIMRANCYPGGIHIIGNAGIDSLMRKLAQHGPQNDVNKTLEFAGKKFHYTNNVTNGEGKNGTFFAVEDGNVAILTRFDREAVRRASANGHEWDVVMMPYLGIEVGTHYYTSVGDQSATVSTATADLNCGVKEFFGFSVDVAFVTAYNSDPDTIAQPIIKAEIAAAGTNVPLAQPVYVINASDFPSGN